MRVLLLLFLTGLVIFLSYHVIIISNKKQQLQHELAELRHIQYGLFNIESWKEQLTVIVKKWIRDYNATPETKAKIKAHIEQALFRLLDEIEEILQRKSNEGNLAEKIVKRVVYELAFDMEAFKLEIPRYSEEIMETLESPESRIQIEKFAEDSFGKIMDEINSGQDKTALQAILAKYNSMSPSRCIAYLEHKLIILEQDLWRFSIPLLLLAFLVFALCRIYFRFVPFTGYFIPAILATLLTVGITIPMISIDVRIKEFGFEIMGGNIIFLDQLLYFKSKSILQVIQILLEDANIFSVLTGSLILLFSILFPLSKIFAICFEEVSKKSTQLSTFLINKTGKWSMADVMVVSIFLAYMGINSFLDNMLNLRSASADYVTILPNTGDSSLELGVLFFTVFVVLSLMSKPGIKQTIQSP